MFYSYIGQSVFEFEADHLSSYRPQDPRYSENNLQYFLSGTWYNMVWLWMLTIVTQHTGRLLVLLIDQTEVVGECSSEYTCRYHAGVLR